MLYTYETYINLEFISNCTLVVLIGKPFAREHIFDPNLYLDAFILPQNFWTKYENKC